MITLGVGRPITVSFPTPGEDGETRPRVHERRGVSGERRWFDVGDPTGSGAPV